MTNRAKKKNNVRLVLASASPARLKSLRRAAGIEPEVLVSGVDESTVTSDSPEELCVALARLKARVVVDRLPDRSTDTLVLGCDSVLAFDGEILGKPADAADAVRRWQRMRGRSGVLHSGHCLIDLGRQRASRPSPRPSSGSPTSATTRSSRTSRPASRSPWPGRSPSTASAGPSSTVSRAIRGTVVGLSLPLLRSLLGELDVRIIDLWTKVAPGGQSIEPLG